MENPLPCSCASDTGKLMLMGLELMPGPRPLGGRLARGLRVLLIRSNRSPLRPLLAATSELFIRLLAFYLSRGLPAAVYVRGSFGRDEPVFGLSDIDLIAVTRGHGRVGEDRQPLVTLRWQRLERRLPLVSRLVDVKCYLESELSELTSTRYTYGLTEPSPRSLFFAGGGHAVRRAPGVVPYLWPMQNWRPVSRRDLRPQSAALDPAETRLLAWADLQFWWHLAFQTVGDPTTPWASYACVKLVAEPARILLYLEHGEQHFGRSRVLQRALELLPEEEPALRFALALLGELHRVPVAPLEVVLPCFVRLSARIARQLAAGLEPLGATTVALHGVRQMEASGPTMPGPLPLCDWPALAQPPSSEESFAVDPGRCDDPAALAGALRYSATNRYATLLCDGLIVRPSLLPRGRHRTVAFAGNDPVSAALVAGGTSASYPNAPGWGAADTAARAVIEHRAWLQSVGRLGPDAPTAVRLRRLSGLFSAARAGLFLDSLESPQVTLPVTFAATVEVLADRLPRHRKALEEASTNYRAAVESGTPLPLSSLESLTGALNALGCYASR
jgi:hypothetical protein